jgi:hypothetical protein
MSTPSIILQPDSFRINIRKKFHDKYRLLQKDCNNIEKSIFNWCIHEAEQQKILKKWDNPRFVKMYLSRLKSIYVNINPDILSQINNNTLISKNIGFMTHQELNPDKWEKLIEVK